MKSAEDTEYQQENQWTIGEREGVRQTELVSSDSVSPREKQQNTLLVSKAVYLLELVRTKGRSQVLLTLSHAMMVG